MDHHLEFSKIFIDETSLSSPVGQRALKLYPSKNVQVVSEHNFKEFKGQMSSEEFSESKRRLWIRPYPGSFFKRCPGATQKKSLTCCNYFILNLGSQCNFNCSYCYLQSYLNNSTLQIYSNLDKALNELEEFAKVHPDLPYRVGTGEITDSLSLDPITLYSKELIGFFTRFPKWTLEFKTKSSFVDQFLDTPHAGNVVVSWSLNSEDIVTREEHGTASLEARLQAAKKCRDKGFSVAFHLDPLIPYSNWRTGYADLVDRITQKFDPEQVHIISLGTLRFQPEQKVMMRERFGMKSLVNQAELFPSAGGKLRIDAQLRNEMYDFVRKRFIMHSDRWKIFLCMETPETWIQTMDSYPMQKSELRSFFRPLPTS
jgi:spore photoproduct lyase